MRLLIIYYINVIYLLIDNVKFLAELCPKAKIIFNVWYNVKGKKKEFESIALVI